MPNCLGMILDSTGSVNSKVHVEVWFLVKQPQKK